MSYWNTRANCLLTGRCAAGCGMGVPGFMVTSAQRQREAEETIRRSRPRPPRPQTTTLWFRASRNERVLCGLGLPRSSPVKLSNSSESGRRGLLPLPLPPPPSPPSPSPSPSISPPLHHFTTSPPRPLFSSFSLLPGSNSSGQPFRTTPHFS
jgi:hypothetical protein